MTVRHRFVTCALAGWTLLMIAGPLMAERVRPNIDSLKPPQLEVLQAAMKAIKALPDSDPQSYGYLRDTHDGLNGPCEHGSDVFLPWHRELLLQFEKALQSSGVAGAETIILPYWDWSLPPSGKRYPKICEDPSSEFYHPKRIPPGGPDLPFGDLTKAMGETTWERFGGTPLSQGGSPGKLERPPHNFMHAGYVGGDMAFDFTAGRDPCFWLFHTGIDYFWWKWQQKNQDAQPVDPSYQLRGFGNTTIGDVWKTDRLGYTYKVAEKKTLLHEGFASSVRTMARTGATPTIDHYGFDFVVPDPGFEQAELVISDVKLAGASSYIARYYAHPASVEYSADEAFQKKYLAATDAHFGGVPDAVGAHGHHPAKGDVRVDVTDALAAIAEGHAGETWRITAVYEGPRDQSTGQPSSVFLGRDVNQGAIHLVLDEE